MERASAVRVVGLGCQACSVLTIAIRSHSPFSHLVVPTSLARVISIYYHGVCIQTARCTQACYAFATPSGRELNRPRSLQRVRSMLCIERNHAARQPSVSNSQTFLWHWHAVVAPIERFALHSHQASQSNCCGVRSPSYASVLVYNIVWNLLQRTLRPPVSENYASARRRLTCFCLDSSWDHADDLCHQRL